MSKYPNWTEDEKKMLCELYPTIPAYELSNRMNRPTTAIIQKAAKMKLKAHRTLHWTNTWRFLNGNNPYNVLPKEDLAYIAGIFDGEGYLDMDKRGFWRLGIANTYKPLIDWLGRRISYSTFNFHRRQNPKWKEVYNWNLHGNLKVKALLKLLLPYLTVKQLKALVAIKDIEDRNVELSG